MKVDQEGVHTSGLCYTRGNWFNLCSYSCILHLHHKRDRTEPASGSLYSYTQDSNLAGQPTPTPWLMLLLVLIKVVLTKNRVKQVKWNQLIKTEGKLR